MATTKKKATRKAASTTKAKAKAGSSGAKSKTAAKPQRKPAQAAAKPKASDKPVAKKPAASKRMSALDAAAQVLKEVKKAMSCKDLTETILKRGLWKTNGKTPAATLYAAIHREIDRKGKEARFEKVDRGMFALRKG